MTNDLRAAAAYILRDEPGMSLPDYPRIMDAANKLAVFVRDYLAGRSEDDGVLLDFEYWTTFATDMNYWGCVVHQLPSGEFITFDHNCLCLTYRGDTFELLDKPTRGQTRRLIAALKGE